MHMHLATDTPRPTLAYDISRSLTSARSPSLLRTVQAFVGRPASGSPPLLADWYCELVRVESARRVRGQSVLTVSACGGRGVFRVVSFRYLSTHPTCRCLYVCVRTLSVLLLSPSLITVDCLAVTLWIILFLGLWAQLYRAQMLPDYDFEELVR